MKFIKTYNAEADFGYFLSRFIKVLSIAKCPENIRFLVGINKGPRCSKYYEIAEEAITYLDYLVAELARHEGMVFLKLSADDWPGPFYVPLSAVKQIDLIYMSDRGTFCILVNRGYQYGDCHSTKESAHESFKKLKQALDPMNSMFMQGGVLTPDAFHGVTVQ